MIRVEDFQEKIFFHLQFASPPYSQCRRDESRKHDVVNVEMIAVYRLTSGIVSRDSSSENDRIALAQCTALFAFTAVSEESPSPPRAVNPRGRQMSLILVVFQ